MPISLMFWEWGCPYHCEPGLSHFLSKVFLSKNMQINGLQNNIDPLLRDTEMILTKCSSGEQCIGSRVISYLDLLLTNRRPSAS